jgi:flavin-dependent dehydrogenase
MEQVSTIRNCDALIIGSSMAGACLARQLKLRHPEINIVVLEKKTAFDHWVGESTLESFWDYAVKCLDLGYYLDTNHIYKHGLRFFYDSPEHDLPIAEMSEVGRSWFHTTPAHQLDRKRFDTDLYEMNIKSGVNVRLGVTVKDIDIAENGQHTVVASDGKYQCRWLIDAAGFSSPVGAKLNLIRRNNQTHPINAYWGRFKNIANLDLLGDMHWRAKVNHTTRTLATTHFMYGGYWIWLIPIDKETFSIGVTNRTDMVDVSIRGKDQFIEFLKSHHCMRQLLTGESELIDFHKMIGISRQATQVFSESRWFLTGMSAAVLDPILSPGSALLADHNRMIGDLIDADLRGEQREFNNKIKAYNVYSKVWQENFFLHIKSHYHDCFDRQRVLFETLLMQWFGIVLPISMTQSWGYDPNLPDEAFDDMAVMAEKMLAESCIHKIDKLLEDFHSYLRRRGVAYQNNQGQFYDIEIGGDAMFNTRTRGRHLCPQKIQAIEDRMVQVAYKNALSRMSEIEGLAVAASDLEAVCANAALHGIPVEKALIDLIDRDQSTEHTRESAA